MIYSFQYDLSQIIYVVQDQVQYKEGESDSVNMTGSIDV